MSDGAGAANGVGDGWRKYVYAIENRMEIR